MSPDFDVIVAGAGPAGALLARNLASAGFRVGLFDKEELESLGKSIVVDVERTIFPRANLDPPSGQEIAFQAYGKKIFSPKGKEVLSERGLSSTYSIRLDAFVKRLVEEAVEVGAEWLGGHEAVSLLWEREKAVGIKWRSRGEEGEARSQIVVDATGYDGTLVQQMPEKLSCGWKEDERDRVIAANHLHQVHEEEARKSVSQGLQGEDEVWIRLSAYGNYSTEYSFLSAAQNKAYILIGLKSDSDYPPLSQLIVSFRQSRSYFGEWLYGGEGPIRVRRSLDRLVGDGFMVVGEAACQVIPINGSGVGSALYAGGLAAKAARTALREGRTGSEDLWPYCVDYQTTRGRLLAVYDAFKLVIESLSTEQVCAILEAGFLSHEDLEPSGELGLASGGLWGLFQKGARLLRRSGLWGPMTSIVKNMYAANGHYASYPRQLERKSMEIWSRRSLELMRRARDPRGLP